MRWGFLLREHVLKPICCPCQKREMCPVWWRCLKNLFSLPDLFPPNTRLFCPQEGLAGRARLQKTKQAGRVISSATQGYSSRDSTSWNNKFFFTREFWVPCSWLQILVTWEFASIKNRMKCLLKGSSVWIIGKYVIWQDRIIIGASRMDRVPFN